MTGEYFTFDNGRDRRRVDYDQFLLGLEKESGTSRNEDLWKLFSLFDKDGSGKIDTPVEANELFGFIKEMAGPDDILEEEEIRGWLNRNGFEFGFGTDDNNIFAAASEFISGLSEGKGITYKDGRIVKVESEEGIVEYIYNDEEGYVEVVFNGHEKYRYSELNNDGTVNENSRIIRKVINGVESTYEYHEADEVHQAYVEIKTGENDVIRAAKVDIKGRFTANDFISREYINEDNQKVTIGYMQVGEDSLLISEKTELSNNESITKVYGTTSYHVYCHMKQSGLENQEGMQIYENGDEVYSVYYDENGNTITHAANNDSVSTLITKFGFESSEQFYALNPGLQGRRDNIIYISDQITVPGRYNANDDEILRQGTLKGEYDKWYNYYENPRRQEENIRAIRNEYFPSISDEIFNALQQINGFEFNEDNIGFYSRINSLRPEDQQKALDGITYFSTQYKEPNGEHPTDPDRIKQLVMHYYSIYNPETYNYSCLCLFDSGKYIPMASVEYDLTYGDENAPCPLERFLTEKLNLDITQGEGKRIYERLACIPQDVLDRISLSTYCPKGQVSFAGLCDFYRQVTFDDIADSFLGLLDINIRTDSEMQAYELDQNIKFERWMQTPSGQAAQDRADAARYIALAYNNVIAQISQYQDSQGWLNVGYWRELAGRGIADVRQWGRGLFPECFEAEDKACEAIDDWTGFTNFSNVVCNYRDMIKVIEEERDNAVAMLKGNAYSPDWYKENFKLITEGAEYNEENMHEFLSLAREAENDPEKWNDKNYVNSFWDAYSKAFGIPETNRGGETTYKLKIASHYQKHIDRQQFVDGAGDIGVMLIATEGIGEAMTLFLPKKLKTTITIEKLIMGAVKPTTWTERAIALGSSGMTFMVWEDAKLVTNYLTNDIDEDFALFSWQGLGKTSLESFGFGMFSAGWNMLVTNPIMYSKAMGKLFKSPEATKVAEEATAKVSNGLKGKRTFTAGQIVRMFNKAQETILKPLGRELGREAIGLVPEVVGFTIYGTVTGTLEKILEKDEFGNRKDYTWEDFWNLAWEELQGQVAGLIEIKAIARILYMRKTGKLAMDNSHLSENNDVVFTRETDGSNREIFKVEYPDGRVEYARTEDECIDIARKYADEVNIYRPIDQLLTQEGELDLADGMKIVKDGDKYVVKFADNTSVEGTNLRDVLSKANEKYTRESYRNRAISKGSVEINGQLYVYDEQTQKFRTEVDGRRIESTDFKEVTDIAERANYVRRLSERMSENGNRVRLSPDTFLSQGADGKYEVITISEYGEHILIAQGNTLEEVVDQLYAPKKSNAQPQVIATQTQELEHTVVLGSEDGETQTTDARTSRYRSGVITKVEIEGIEYTYIYDRNGNRLAVLAGEGPYATVAYSAYANKTPNELKAELRSANEYGSIPQRDAIVAELRRRGYTVEFTNPDVVNGDYTTSFHDEINVSYNSPIPPETNNEYINRYIRRAKQLYADGRGNYDVDSQRNGNEVTTRLIDKNTGKIVLEIVEQKDAQDNTTNIKTRTFKPEGKVAVMDYSVTDGNLNRYETFTRLEIDPSLIDRISTETIFDFENMETAETHPAENTGVRENASVGENQAQQPANPPVDNNSVDATTQAVSAGEGTRTPTENNVVSGIPAAPTTTRTPEQIFNAAVDHLKANTSLDITDIKDLADYGINIREDAVQDLIIYCQNNGIDFRTYARFCSENSEGNRLQSAEVKERADFIRRALENKIDPDDISDLISVYEETPKTALEGLLTEYAQKAEVTSATQRQFETKKNAVIQRASDTQVQDIIRYILNSSVCTEDNFDKIADLIGDNPNLARIEFIKRIIDGGDDVIPEMHLRKDGQSTLDALKTYFDNALVKARQILADYTLIANITRADINMIETVYDKLSDGDKIKFNNAKTERIPNFNAEDYYLRPTGNPEIDAKMRKYLSKYNSSKNKKTNIERLNMYKRLHFAKQFMEFNSIAEMSLAEKKEFLDFMQCYSGDLTLDELFKPSLLREVREEHGIENIVRTILDETVPLNSSRQTEINSFLSDISQSVDSGNAIDIISDAVPEIFANGMYTLTESAIPALKSTLGKNEFRNLSPKDQQILVMAILLRNSTSNATTDSQIAFNARVVAEKLGMNLSDAKKLTALVKYNNMQMHYENCSSEIYTLPTQRGQLSFNVTEKGIWENQAALELKDGNTLEILSILENVPKSVQDGVRTWRNNIVMKQQTSYEELCDYSTEMEVTSNTGRKYRINVVNRKSIPNFHSYIHFRKTDYDDAVYGNNSVAFAEYFNMPGNDRTLCTSYIDADSPLSNNGDCAYFLNVAPGGEISSAPNDINSKGKNISEISAEFNPVKNGGISSSHYIRSDLSFDGNNAQYYQRMSEIYDILGGEILTFAKLRELAPDISYGYAPLRPGSELNESIVNLDGGRVSGIYFKNPNGQPDAFYQDLIKYGIVVVSDSAPIIVINDNAEGSNNKKVNENNLSGASTQTVGNPVKGTTIVLSTIATSHNNRSGQNETYEPHLVTVKEFANMIGVSPTNVGNITGMAYYHERVNGQLMIDINSENIIKIIRKYENRNNGTIIPQQSTVTVPAVTAVNVAENGNAQTIRTEFLYYAEKNNYWHANNVDSEGRVAFYKNERGSVGELVGYGVIVNGKAKFLPVGHTRKGVFIDMPSDYTPKSRQTQKEEPTQRTQQSPVTVTVSEPVATVPVVETPKQPVSYERNWTGKSAKEKLLDLGFEDADDILNSFTSEVENFLNLVESMNLFIDKTKISPTTSLEIFGYNEYPDIFTTKNGSRIDINYLNQQITKVQNDLSNINSCKSNRINKYINVDDNGNIVTIYDIVDFDRITNPELYIQTFELFNSFSVSKCVECNISKLEIQNGSIILTPAANSQIDFSAIKRIFRARFGRDSLKAFYYKSVVSNDPREVYNAICKEFTRKHTTDFGNVYDAWNNSGLRDFWNAHNDFDNESVSVQRDLVDIVMDDDIWGNTYFKDYHDRLRFIDRIMVKSPANLFVKSALKNEIMIFDNAITSYLTQGEAKDGKQVIQIDKAYDKSYMTLTIEIAGDTYTIGIGEDNTPGNKNGIYITTIY